MDHQTYEAFSWKIASAYLKTAPQNSCICPAGLYLLLPTISDEASGKAKEELELLLPGVSSQDAGELHRLLGACPAIQSRAQVLLPTQPGEENPYELRLREIFGDALHTQASEDHSLTMIHHIDFKDDWKKRFTETVGTFYPTPENSRSIPFIRQDAAAVNHRETNAFISVAIPFSAGCHMVLAMPKGRELSACVQDPAFLQEALTLPDISSPWLPLADLALPTFQIQNHTPDLKPTLQSLGVHQVFDDSTSHITKIGDNEMYIKTVKQEAEVEVTAQGASAHAMTLIELCTCAGGAPARRLTKQITLDRPFLFAIWQSRPTPLPLFIGAFQAP